MNKFKKMLPYPLVIALAFYLLPLLIIDTGSAMLMLLVVMPLTCFIASVIYGAKNGFNLFFCVLVSILFATTIFIFYNLSAWVYILGYGVAAMIGNAVGMIFYKRVK